MTEQKSTEIATVNHQIEAINKRIGAIKDELNKTHEEIKTHIEQRDQLNEKARALRQEIVDVKKERDQLNVNVKALKRQRDEIRGQMTPFIDTIKEHSQKIRELEEKRFSKSGKNRQALQKAFDSLEFKIATTSMDLQEEKKLIDQVKEIEIQLSVYKKIDMHNKKIRDTKNELNAYQTKANAFHNELTENAKKSQELHSKMISKFEEMKKIREDATNVHLQFLLAKEKIKPFHEEIARCIEQRQKLFGVRQGQYEERQKQFEANRVENERQKKAKEQEIKEKMGSAVREKLQRGEKLDWREFQLLVGDDSETED